MIKYLFRGFVADSHAPVTGDLVHTASGIAIRPLGGDAVPVREQTLGQATGMKDADGNDIFEGDIIQDREGHRILVARDAEAPAFVGLSPMAVARHKEHLCSSSRYLAAACGEMRIIGNIHQAPGLIEP